jgi:hypothetical protein
MHLVASTILAALASLVAATRPYVLTDNYIGYDFLLGFEHQAIPDPTHGRV